MILFKLTSVTTPVEGRVHLTHELTLGHGLVLLVVEWQIARMPNLIDSAIFEIDYRLVLIVKKLLVFIFRQMFHF